MAETYILKIFRGHPGHQYWEEFELPLVPLANVISSLMEIQKTPINRQGQKVEPVVWESGCLEEVCGSCSMLINGFPRQACTALIEPIIQKTGSNIITLAPFTKFPLVRDLIIDRSIMFENLKKVHAWIDVDGSHEGQVPKFPPKSKRLCMHYRHA
jgi:succinate dehydrogenase / fumarate reductase, iron-sulfur subunit